MLYVNAVEKGMDPLLPTLCVIYSRLEKMSYLRNAMIVREESGCMRTCTNHFPIITALVKKHRNEAVTPIINLHRGQSHTHVCVCVRK